MLSHNYLPYIAFMARNKENKGLIQDLTSYIYRKQKENVSFSPELSIDYDKTGAEIYKKLEETIQNNNSGLTNGFLWCKISKYLDDSKLAGVAQSVERRTRNAQVAGSNPAPSSTLFALFSQGGKKFFCNFSRQ